MKSSILLLALSLSATAVFAAPTIDSIDFTKQSSKPYSLAFDVTAVKSLTERTGFSVVLQTLTQEGSLNSNQVLIHVISPESEEAYFAVKTDLASVGSFKLKWENGAGSNAGLYLTMKGYKETKRKYLEIKLVDSTGVLLEAPQLNLHD